MLALAEYVAGSDEGFTELMNRRALELGMNDTFFADSGGYNEDSLSSARDAAVMTAALFELGFEHGALTKSFTTRLSAVREGTERETQLVNTNGLAHWFEGVLGGKAAHSAASGFCLTNAAERGNMRLTAVVLGAGNEDDRVNLSELLLESGFKDFEFVTPDIDPALLTPVRVERGVERFVGVKPANPIRFIAAKGSGSGAKFDVTLPQTLPAPVGAGQVVGKLTVRLGEKTVAEYDLIAVAAVQELSFTKSVEIMLRRFFRL
jgi:D-alanyl-D-alanine carboxypeptidase (penicillin-binding protein 5/6)